MEWSGGRWGGTHGLRVKLVPESLSPAVPTCLWGVSFSPALLKMAKLSAPGLRFGSRGSQACVAWPTCVLILEVGKELSPVKSEKIPYSFGILTSLVKSGTLATLAFISSR